MSGLHEHFEAANLPLPVMMEGIMLPPQPFHVPWEQHINELRTLTLRDDDVFLCAYPKAGTHWLWEVIYMLLHGKVTYEARTKEFMMIEFSSKERLEAEASPRIFNTHLPFSMLPVQDIKRKKIKVVHVYRNPKDTVVSQWFHFKQFGANIFKDFEQFIQAFINGPMLFGTYPDYLKQTEKFMDDNPDIPFFNVSYEETKKHPVETVQRLAKFLGVSASDQLCRDIADACSFQKMKEADKSKAVVKDAAIPLNQDIYRKGEVGDWKNHLSAKDEALMDKFIADRLQGLTKFKLEYTP
ncbi:sulfotransferase 6B1-like isoform X2 [Littorina saxatilis]